MRNRPKSPLLERTQCRETRRRGLVRLSAGFLQKEKLLEGAVRYRPWPPPLIAHSYTPYNPDCGLDAATGSLNRIMVPDGSGACNAPNLLPSFSCWRHSFMRSGSDPAVTEVLLIITH
jgi:hypothetical protein